LVLPHLSVVKRGKKSSLCLVKVFLLKRLKTGIQWRGLSKINFFQETVLWQNFYYYFNKWSKNGSFLKVWQQLLLINKLLLDFPEPNLMALIHLANEVERALVIKPGNLAKPLIA
jgi:hypothetical protein